MKFKRILGIALCIVGIALIIFSKYIKGQVAEGREKIGKAQKQVEQGEKLFSFDPTAKKIGKGASSIAQGKLDEASQEASHYEELSKYLQIGGIVLIIAGVIILFIPHRKGSSREK